MARIEELKLAIARIEELKLVIARIEEARTEGVDLEFELPMPNGSKINYVYS